MVKTINTNFNHLLFEHLAQTDSVATDAISAWVGTHRSGIWVLPMLLRDSSRYFMSHVPHVTCGMPGLLKFFNFQSLLDSDLDMSDNRRRVMPNQRLKSFLLRQNCFLLFEFKHMPSEYGVIRVFLRDNQP